MARGNMLLGTTRGKLGDVVFYRRNGKQAQRTRVTPSNPKSEAQCRNRMIMHTLSTAASRLKKVVDHSFEGVRYGQKSTNHFIKINHAMAKAIAAKTAASIPDGIGKSFCLKGANNLALLNYEISRGQLSMKDYAIFTDLANVRGAELLGTQFGNLLGNMANAADYEAKLAELGLVPGDQLTIVAVATTGTEAAAYEATGASADEMYVEFARIVFKNSDEIDFSAPFAFLQEDSGFYAINPSVAVLQRTSEWVGNVVFTAEDGSSGSTSNIAVSVKISGNLTLTAMGLIRSQLGEGGWLRSNARLVCYPVETDTADLVWPSYGKQQSDASSTRYLNQPVNRRNAPAPSDENNALQIVISAKNFNGTGSQLSLNIAGDVIGARQGVNIPCAFSVVKNGQSIASATDETDLVGYFSTSIQIGEAAAAGDVLSVTVACEGYSVTETATVPNA